MQLVVSVADWCQPPGQALHPAACVVAASAPYEPAGMGYVPPEQAVVQVCEFAVACHLPFGQTAHVCVAAEKDPAGHVEQPV